MCKETIDNKNFIDQMQQLTTLFATNKIAIFRKTNQQNFLNYLSNDNYFVLDMNYCKNSWEILQKVSYTTNLLHKNTKFIKLQIYR